MWGMNKRLIELEAQGKPIMVGIVGIGQMGRGMVSQMSAMKGMKPAIISDIDIEKAKKAYQNAKIPEQAYIIAKTVEEANQALLEGKYVIAADSSIVTRAKGIQAVVDATGMPNVGARIALDAIENKKHIIMLNVEADIVIGPLLKKKADEAGVVYTGSAGDEPGSVMELYDFATALGFEVKVFGKGKNNKLDYRANPDNVMEEARKKNMNPKMLASFKDGTKTMVELTAMCNATGFLPDVTGARGPTADIRDLPNIYRLKSEGGILENYRTVDYVNGIAPGVFVIISSEYPDIHEEMRFLKMGDGPNYVLYRPYHLTSLETALSVALAVLDHQPTIVPLHGPIAETVAVAKTDLKAGQRLDGIGGFTVYGVIQSAEEARKGNFVPIGLIDHQTKLLRNISEGEFMTYDMVQLNKDSLVYQLRKEQDKFFAR